MLNVFIAQKSHLPFYDVIVVNSNYEINKLFQ